MKNSKYFSILICVIMLFSFICYIPNNLYAFLPSGETYNGIDVSEWQGEINFSEVKQAGIDIVYIRSSEGTSYIDKYFERNYNEAKSNGLKVGFYHYVTARDNEQAIEEAKFFATVISNKVPDCKLAMDFEYFNGLSNVEINSIGKTFIEEVESITGKQAIIYSDAYNAKYTLFILEKGL